MIDLLSSVLDGFSIASKLLTRTLGGFDPYGSSIIFFGFDYPLTINIPPRIMSIDVHPRVLTAVIDQ